MMPMNRERAVTIEPKFTCRCWHPIHAGACGHSCFVNGIPRDCFCERRARPVDVKRPSDALNAAVNTKSPAVSPKDGAPVTTPERKLFAADLAMIQKTIEILRRDIDHLGEYGVRIAHSEVPDVLACYASNSLEGTQALLRELGRAVLGAAAKVSKKGKHNART